MVTLEELMQQSDFITVHLPKTPETVGLIGEAQFNIAKPNLRVINAARGGIVDEAALYEALKSGRIAGAGLDVYAKEPCTDSPLFTLETVVATPHLGASTDEAQEKAGISVAKSVRLALAGELVPDAVNVQGGSIAEEVRPLLALAEQLGSIASSVTTAALSRVDIEVLGAATEHDVRVLELSALKGVFQALVHDPVSYVNAPLLAEQRGVAVALTTDADAGDHRSLVRVRVTQSDGVVRVVAGVATGSNGATKLVEFGDFDVDVPISEHMAFFRYNDRPGVVGTVGRLLGDALVNIAGMQVSRDKDADNALIVLTVDSEIPAATVEQIKTEIGAHSGRVANLSL